MLRCIARFAEIAPADVELKDRKPPGAGGSASGTIDERLYLSEEWR
jgi:hypothetical protein